MKTKVGKKEIDQFLDAIRSQNDDVRGPAWQGAGQYGAAAVKPLASVLTNQDYEIARAAKRALWKIVHHAGRPGADDERRAVVEELHRALAEGTTKVRRDVAWMLSEIGWDETVAAVAKLFSEEELREDARMVLERIPGEASVAALKSQLASASESFRPNIACSLRQRGLEVPGLPCEKLVPKRKTRVKPVEAN